MLRPVVEVGAQPMVDPAVALHDQAHRLCFIANSVNFPVRYEPTVTVAVATADRAAPT
jgi:organic hydroperoxide reductase OsmC/OhrA